MLLPIYLLIALSSIPQTQPVTHPVTSNRATACAVVTKADVEEAIGRRVNDPTEETAGRSSNCDYAIKGGLVSITIQRLTAKPDLQAEIAALKKEIPEGVVRNSSDFPQACYLDIPGAGTQLHIISNNNQHLMISILGLGDPSEVSAAALQLARKAIARM